LDPFVFDSKAAKSENCARTPCNKFLIGYPQSVQKICGSYLFGIPDTLRFRKTIEQIVAPGGGLTAIARDSKANEQTAEQEKGILIVKH
jgi:hypothetical protein